jgi:hypothetical protein
VRLAPVPRVFGSEFHPPRFGGEPRIIVGDLARWPPVGIDDPAYWKSEIGDVEVAVRERDGPPQNIFQNLARGGRIAFSEYFDWVIETAGDLDGIASPNASVEEIALAVSATGFETSYYLDAKLEQLSPTLYESTPAPDWYGTAPIDVNFWCGVLGTSSGLHCDVTPNCNMQVVGSKQFTLFAPSQSRCLYRVPHITHCRFDPNVPDLEQFPLARDACGLQCTLTAGEALYIPVGWYHQVTVVSDWAINVNVFWRRPLGQGLAIPSLWRFLARRGRARVRRAVSRVADQSRSRTL